MLGFTASVSASPAHPCLWVQPLFLPAEAAHNQATAGELGRSSGIRRVNGRKYYKSKLKKPLEILELGCAPTTTTGRDSVQSILGRPFDPLQEQVQHLTWGCKHVPAQQALMLVERLASHCTLCLRCKCLGAYSPGSLQRVLYCRRRWSCRS